MISARDKVIAGQLALLKEPFEGEKISQALSRIGFAVLPDWGEYRIEAWVVDGLRPIFGSLFSLSPALQEDLLECVSLIYSSPWGGRPDLDLCELKGKLDSLPVSALPFALSIIAREGGEGMERYLRPYADHRHVDVRAEALEALGMLGHSA